jgi:Tfp pilus assembly protein PilF
MRADRLGRGFTPTLDRLAAGGMVFDRARSAVPLTLPSHATILSGRLPFHHGVRENATYAFDRGQPSLATLLHAGGYRTGAVVGAFVLDRRFGLDAGFDLYDDRIPRTPAADVRLESERSATAVTDAALAWADTLAGRGSVPYFLWVHYYDPHAPYDPPPRFKALAGGDLYDGEIAYADAELSRLIAGLSSRGLARRLAMVVAGDHGEALGDHGERTHGMLLYDSTLRVPLILSRPGAITPSRRSDPVTLADIAPTLLEMAGLPGDSGMDGVSLLGPPAPADRECYGESDYPRAAGWSPLRSLVAARWKLIASSSPELYDLASDPAERANLAAERGSIVAAMAARLAAIESRSARPAAGPDAEVQARLRSLGYVSAPASAQPMPAAPSPAAHMAAWREFEDALTRLAAGQPASALPALKALDARYPASPVFGRTYAKALLDAGQDRAALAACRTLVARWPADASLFHDLAVAARRAGRLEEARRGEQAALAIDPRDPAAHNGLGLIDVDLGRDREAAGSFERATSLAPGDASYWVNLGNARRAIGDQAGAADAYRRALAIDASWPDAANGFGVLLVQQGRAAEAVRWFEQAIARDQTLVEAQLNLGIALEQSGQPARAAAAYKRVLAARGDHRQQKEAAAKLLGRLR